MSVFPALVFALTILSQPVPDPVGRMLSADGSFLHRTPGKPTYEAVKKDALITPDDRLIALPGASVASANGAVTLTSRTDYDGKSPFPILETAITLHPPGTNDLDITLDRGRVDLTNFKPSGSAKVRVQFYSQDWTITLDEPNSRVAIEVISRWPAGSPFRKTPMEGHEPAMAAVLVVVSRGVSVSDGKTTLALSAPPGPSLVEWASTGEARLIAQRLETVPAWADPIAELRPTATAAREAAEAFRKRVASGSVTDAIDAFLASNSIAEKHVGLIAAGALDDLPRLNNAVATTHDQELWDFGVSVCCHWLGRNAAQETTLYQFLMDARKFTATEAEITLQLLHGFTVEDQQQPETYEVLIAYLRSPRPAVRNLAAWHLHRLAPAGKTIPFRPNATEVEAQTAYNAWKKLIPTGQIPVMK